jgi:hypothetical protein
LRSDVVDREPMAAGEKVARHRRPMLPRPMNPIAAMIASCMRGANTVAGR